MDWWSFIAPRFWTCSFSQMTRRGVQARVCTNIFRLTKIIYNIINDLIPRVGGKLYAVGNLSFCEEIQLNQLVNMAGRFAYGMTFKNAKNAKNAQNAKSANGVMLSHGDVKACKCAKNLCDAVDDLGALTFSPVATLHLASSNTTCLSSSLTSRLMSALHVPASSQKYRVLLPLSQRRLLAQVHF